LKIKKPNKLKPKFSEFLGLKINKSLGLSTKPIVIHLLEWTHYPLTRMDTLGFFKPKNRFFFKWVRAALIYALGTRNNEK